MFVACIFILLAASLMYYIENDHNAEMFPHIPGSMWWAVNCIATIGYGDVYREGPIPSFRLSSGCCGLIRGSELGSGQDVMTFHLIAGCLGL